MKTSVKFAIFSAVAVLAVDCWAPVAARNATVGTATDSVQTVTWTADVQNPVANGIEVNPGAGHYSAASPNLVIAGVIINLGTIKPHPKKLPCWMPFSATPCL
jgi:hypothetical protein